MKAKEGCLECFDALRENRSGVAHEWRVICERAIEVSRGDARLLVISSTA
jgi:hypothetical protein